MQKYLRIFFKRLSSEWFFPVFQMTSIFFWTIFLVLFSNKQKTNGKWTKIKNFRWLRRIYFPFFKKKSHFFYFLNHSIWRMPPDNKKIIKKSKEFGKKQSFLWFIFFCLLESIALFLNIFSLQNFFRVNL